jgi:hypothetical protein
MVLIIAGFAVCAIAQTANRQTFSLPVNFRIYPSAITQTEVFVVQHPSQANLLFSSANTINLATGFISEGIYISSDGGITWSGSDTCKTGNTTLFHRGDPGITIDKNGKFILTRLGFQDGLFSHFSTDNGVTWSSQRTIALERQDRATTISDNNLNSNYYGRSYTAYVEFLPPFPVKLSYTTDGGSSWSTPLQVNNPSQRSQGAELCTGIDSTIFAVWAGVQSVSPYTEDFIGFARSVNGGNTWSVNEQSIDMNGIQGVLTQKASIRVNGMPKLDVDRTTGNRRGWIYIVTAQKKFSPAGNDPDIVLYRSSNNGQSWSQGIRVNQDPLNNGKIQYFPTVHVDNAGGVNVLYYDDRFTTSDSTGIVLSRSTDGGTSWNDFLVGDHNFKPQSIGGLGQGYQGDNISLASVGLTLLPLWMDNSSGLYQLWTARVPISSLVSVKVPQQIPSEFRLEQNFPNPFNPSTTITYHLPEQSFVSLTMYDLLGNKIETLVQSEQSAGQHFVHFSAENLMASGVYLYRLDAGKNTTYKKMMILK